MAIKTQLRVNQMTGSLGDFEGGITDTRPVSAAANLQGIVLASGSLGGVLSEMASAIQRIHGDGTFAKSPSGEFAHALKIKNAGGLTVGAGGDEFTITESSDDVTLTNTIDNKDIIFNLKTAGSAGELARFDANAGGNVKALRLAQNLQLGFDGTATMNERIEGNGDDLILTAGTNVNIVAAGIDTSGQDINLIVREGQANAFSIDASGGQADLLKVDTSADKVVIHELEIAGNLTVNGTTTTVDTDNLLVKDKLITINDGGAANSANGAGIEFEEDGSVTGFIKVANDRAGFELQAPGNSNTLTVDASASATLTVEASANLNQDVTSDATPTFTGLVMGNAGENPISLPDNQGDALTIKEGSNFYMKFVTTDSSERIEVSKQLEVSALTKLGGNVEFTTAGENSLAIPDNQGDALTVKEGNNFYMKFRTTNTEEAVQIFKPIDLQGADGDRVIMIPDNEATAFSIAQDSNEYLKFDTQDSGPGLIIAGKEIQALAGLEVGNGSSSAGFITFKEDGDNGSNFMKLQGPATLSDNNLVITLPANTGTAGQVVQTDGNGNLSFVTAGGSASAKKIKGVVAGANGIAAGTLLSGDGAFSAYDHSVLNGTTAPNALDVFVNGQLLVSCSSGDFADNAATIAGNNTGDYLISEDFSAGNNGDVKFTFALEKDDVVVVAIRG